MRLSYLERTATLLCWSEDNKLEVTFQVFWYGDVAILYGAIGREDSSLAHAFPEVLRWVQRNGGNRIEGYVKPGMYRYLRRLAGRLGGSVIQTDEGVVDGQEMVWVKIYPGEDHGTASGSDISAGGNAR